MARAYRGWAEDLRRWFKEHPEAHERALLVAAAALAPSEEKNVYSVASSLAERLKITMNGAGLVWCPVTDLRNLLGAETNGDRVVFRRHGFAESTLRHVLSDFPLTHADVLSWLAALPTDAAVPRELQEPLVVTFATLAAEHGSPGQIADAAREWADVHLPDLAFIVLSRTCLDSRVGGGVRHFLYEWSRTARTPQTLKLTIARVCEPLGQAYPSVALTRLKHLATHGNDQVVREVITAAMGLAGWGLRQEVLAAAIRWSAGADRERLSLTARRRRIRAGVMLFLRLAGQPAASGLPEILDGEPACDPRESIPAWRAALHDRAAGGDHRDAFLSPIVDQWLDTALHRPLLRGHLIQTFIEAARPPAVTTSTGPAVTGHVAARMMMNMARGWAAADPADPARREIKEAIVIPLTRPWYLKLLKVLYVWLRTRATND